MTQGKGYLLGPGGGMGTIGKIWLTCEGPWGRGGYTSMANEYDAGK